MTATARIIVGDVIDGLGQLEAGSVHTCVTSPPYWGLRDYGHNGQLGLEKTPDEYVERMVDVFRAVRRVLRDDGTLWLNLGDSYANKMPGGQPAKTQSSTLGPNRNGLSEDNSAWRRKYAPRDIPADLKPKDLCGIPWRVAFALQADGWYLRQDIIWHKPNPMPESVRDRCTKAHEYIFLLSKSGRYYYDREAIREDPKPWNNGMMAAPKCGPDRVNGTQNQTVKQYDEIKGANRRSVWTVTTKPYKGAHFATFPPDLIEPCVLAGCPVGGTVLDPFTGSGTTAAVALKHGRNAVGVELNPEYADLARKRIAEVAPLFLEASA